jgi:hypothetical protein
VLHILVAHYRGVAGTIIAAASEPAAQQSPAVCQERPTCKVFAEEGSEFSHSCVTPSALLLLLCSYLGYGLMAGRAKVMDALQATQGAHPCFSKVGGVQQPCSLCT